ncbi:MAG: hypothetical protein D6E12_13810 [Desulfovibrio sp.]|nr:MAG: hypothetical protein D6E12_13810 [Desulfovibrio sp.]
MMEKKVFRELVLEGNGRKRSDVGEGKVSMGAQAGERLLTARPELQRRLASFRSLETAMRSEGGVAPPDGFVDRIATKAMVQETQGDAAGPTRRVFGISPAEGWAMAYALVGLFFAFIGLFIAVEIKKYGDPGHYISWVGIEMRLAMLTALVFSLLSLLLLKGGGLARKAILAIVVLYALGIAIAAHKISVVDSGYARNSFLLFIGAVILALFSLFLRIRIQVSTRQENTVSIRTRFSREARQQ